MKFVVPLLLLCLYVTSGLAQIESIWANWKFIAGALGASKKAFHTIREGTIAVVGKQISCYECTYNSKDLVPCAQGNVLKKCDSRKLLSKFGDYLKTKFLRQPQATHACLRASIRVGSEVYGQYSCAMVGMREPLDETTCKSSLYMLGGITGAIESCALCTDNGCNTHMNLPTETPVETLQFDPMVHQSVSYMPLGHMESNINGVRYGRSEKLSSTSHSSRLFVYASQLGLQALCFGLLVPLYNYVFV